MSTTAAGGSSSRRNVLRRADLPWVLGIAAVAAAGAALAGCEPTGNALGDTLACATLAAFVVWLGATASWWSLAVAGGIAAVAGGGWLPVAAGVAAAGLALWVGDQRASVPWMRSASAALAVQGLLRLEHDPFFTASALLALAGLGLIGAVGFSRRRRHVRRRVLLGLASLAGAAVVATLAFGISAVAARSDTQDGYQGLLDGLNALQSGDPSTAAATLRQAADRLRAADDGVGAAWAQPARLVPVVAQHQQALATLVHRAAASADAAADALDAVDFDALRLEQGRIDVVAVGALAAPLDRLQRAVADLRQALTDVDSPWLVGAIAERLDRYRSRADDTARQAAAAHSAAVNGPAMLGSDGARRYFVGFASPAEARGLVGVMGNYAILTIDGGQIERSEFGRINDLRNDLDGVDFALDGSAEFHTRYGPYGAGDPPSPSFWSNATMTPDMPTAASAIAQLWAARGGEPLDGVIIADPRALAALLQITGPVAVEGLDEPLDSSNVEQFLLVDQYALDTPERRDLLEAVADATLGGVLDGSLPGPQEIARALGPAATEGHLSMWAARPEEQALLRLVGMDGALPALAGRDGLAVVTDNASANKIDSFLRRAVDYRATYDSASGVVEGTVTITLSNDAPASGYPDYVIGSEFLDIPLGTNRTLLTVYTPLEEAGATLDGEATGLDRDTELGWNAFTLRLDLAPGETRTVVVHLSGTVDPGGYALVVRPQPVAQPDSVRVEVGGDADVSWDGPVRRRSVLDAGGASPAR